MITFLSKIFIKNNKDYENPQVRTGYGILCGAVGICLNLLLFLIKFLAGSLSHSIAIVADAFNNLSDAGSSLISLLGFRLANTKPDTDHPYGHGRIEYLSGLMVSALILFMGYELVSSGIERILHPQETAYTPLVFGILVLSVLIKLYMYVFNHAIGCKIHSATLLATGTDSLSDMVSTSAVLACSLICHFFQVNLEGICGTVVGILILYAGYKAARETISPLLGQAPSPELVDEIRSLVLQGEGVLGIHDLMVHDYGPGRLFISLHAEVPADGDIMVLHDSIDNLERMLAQKLHCIAVIHMDPICNKDAETVRQRDEMERFVKGLSPKLSIHDFRIVKGPTHTNLIFDVLSPYDSPISDEALLATIREHIASLDGNFYGVITLDKI